MPTIAEISAYIEEIAPKSLAEEWDNVGTLINCNGEVSSVLVALDITQQVVQEAQLLGCQLIVSHHPVIFRPLHSVSSQDTAFQLVKHNISAICAHTNLDSATGGVNDVLAGMFPLQNVQPFANGLGRIGQLANSISPSQLAKLCTHTFNTPVRMADAGRAVQTLALIGGSGGSMLRDAVQAGADCLLTGEAGHHDAIDAKQAGVSLIVAGHFSTEFPVVPVLADRLTQRFPSLKVLASQQDKDPFSYISL